MVLINNMKPSSRFNAKMSMLALTLKNSTKALVSFSILFFVTFFAYASFAYLGTLRKDTSRWKGWT